MKENCPYQRVEYLEASEEGGFAYINTEHIPMIQDVTIITSIVINGYSNSTKYIPIIGDVTSGAYSSYAIVRSSDLNNAIQLYCGSTNSKTGSSVSIELGKIYNIAMYGASQKFSCNEINGSLQPYYAVPSPYPIRLFGYNSVNRAYCKIYNFILRENNKSVLDMIPVRVGGEGFMYDRVSGKLFGNAGTGRFILGPDINS